MIRLIFTRIVSSCWEFLVALFCLIAAVSYLSGEALPASIQTVFPQWLRWIWGFLLVLGGAGVLYGLITNNASVERFALWLLGGGSMAYAFAIIGLNGFAKGGLSAAFVVSTGLACFIQLGQRALLTRLEGRNEFAVRASR